MSSHSDFIHYYNEFKHKIFTYILYRVSFDRKLAEDLAAEVFLKAYEYFETYDASRPFKAWIYTIAHNHLMNHFAKKKSESLSIEEAEQLAQEATYVEELGHKINFACVVKALKKLSRLQHDIILLRYQNDLSISEIASIVHKEEGAVRITLSRALAALRQCLTFIR